jgi:hypothetical protein
MFAVASHFPITWYAPISTGAAVWFLAAAIYTYRKGCTYAGRGSAGGYHKISRAEDPKRFRLWLSLMVVLFMVFSGLAIRGFIAHPIG